MFDPRGPTFLELAEQAFASTRRGYDLLAPKFDWTPFRTPEWLLDAVAPHLGEPGSIGRSVDLCCGTGAALPLLQRVSRDLVVGVDFSLGMLAEARSRPSGGAGAARSGRAGGGAPGRAEPSSASTNGKPPASGDPWSAVPAPPLGERPQILGDKPRTLFVQQDVLQIGFRETFELATIFGALGHLRPAVQARFLAQARSCLVPGGTLAFVTAPVPPPWSLSLWLAAAFDGAMWLRNRLWRPPFYMYYLAWPLPRALRLLRENGFAPEVRPLGLRRPLSGLRLVLARRA